MLEFVAFALRRYRLAASACAALAAACAGLASQAVPEVFPVTAEVLVIEPVAVHRLANPFAPLPSARHELAEVPELLRSRERLVAIVKRTGLLDQWDRGRPWPLRLKDRLLERLVGPVPEHERLDALAAMLDARLSVTVQDGNRVRIACGWSAPELSLRIVENAVGSLMQLRTQREGNSLDEAAVALDRQLELVRTEMHDRAARVEELLGTPGGWAQSAGEREQLMRDSTRAGELLVALERKRITAEVFKQSNALRFTLVRPPLLPREAAGPSRPVRLAVGALAALAAGLACAVLLALVSGRLLSRAQLRGELGLEVLGSLPVPSSSVVRRPSAPGVLLVVALALATGGAVGVSRSNLLVSVLPSAAFLGAWLLWTRPLKWPLLAVMLLAVTLDDPTDRAYFGLWQSPLWPLGRVFFTNIALFTGVEFCILGLTALMGLRRLWLPREQVARLDPLEHPPPRPLVHALLLSGAVIGWLVVMGLGRGGVFREALWQFRHLLMMPLVGLLTLYALDLPKDLPRLLAVLVTGSVVRSLLGIFFMYGVASPLGAQPPHTTGHNDTMTFVTAVVTAMTLCWERGSRRHFALLVLWLPLVALALKLNDRRIAYVEIVMAAAVIYLLSPLHEMKRRLTRVGLLLAPAVLLYTAAGWNQLNSSVFAPVQKVRSIIAPPEDTEEESSNVERDIENYNLMKSWEQNMLVGQGFGHAFTEFIPSNDFGQSAFGHIGHNSILWLWWIGGLTGFTGVLAYLAVALYLAGRTLQRATDYRERAGLLVAVGIIVTYLVQAFGDMGTQATMFDFFVGTSLAIIGRLAARHGAYRVEPAAEPSAQGPEAITA